MKNNLILIFFASLAILKDFDLSMDIYSDVNSNNVFVLMYPNQKKIIKYPLTFISFFEKDTYLGYSENSVVRLGDFNMDNIVNLQDIKFMLDLSDQFGYDSYFDVNEDFNLDILDVMKIIDLSKKINHPSNFEIIPVQKKIEGESFFSENNNSDMIFFRYPFVDSQESVTFWSKDFDNIDRKFNFQFMFMPKLPLYPTPSSSLIDSIKSASGFLDSITVKLNFFSPISDNIDLKYYPDYNNPKNKEKFIDLKLSKNQLKELGSPIITSFITVPNSFDLPPTSAIKINYENPQNLTLQNIIETAEKKHALIRRNLEKAPIIILVTILGIMLIFIVLLTFNQYTRKEDL